MNNPTSEKGPDVSHHIQGPESKERNSIVFQNQLIRKTQTNAMEVDGERSPVVDVELNLPAAMTVSWACAFCKQRHSHGAPYAWLEPLGAIIGHRASHCFSDDSPLLGRSYYMRLVGTHEVQHQSRRHPRTKKNDFVLLSAEQARQVTRQVASRDERYALATIGPDDPTERLPYGFANPRTMTVAVPACGIYLGSLLSELAALPEERRGRTLTVDERLRRDAKVRKTALATLRSVNAAAQMVLQ